MTREGRPLAPEDPPGLWLAQGVLVLLVVGGGLLALRVQVPTQLSGPALIGAQGELSAHLPLSASDRLEPGMRLEFTLPSGTAAFTLTGVSERGEGLEVRARPAGSRALLPGSTGTATVRLAPRSLLSVLTSALAPGP